MKFPYSQHCKCKEALIESHTEDASEFNISFGKLEFMP